MIISRIANVDDLDFIIDEINGTDVARHVNDDFTLESRVEKSQINLNHFLIIEEDGQAKGFFYFQNINSITIDIHTCIRNVKNKLIAGASTIEFFRCAGVEVIISFIPSYNSAAFKYAKMLGFEEVGRIAKSYLFNNQAIDQIIVSKNIKGE
jgi:hypothetical protein